jgi:LmbE family N-acetylglucosaminyl deacetylase
MTMRLFPPGRGTATWRRSRATPRWLDLARFGRVLLLAPHPDDETLGAGGLIAQARAAGATVSVVLLTAGEAEPGAAGDPGLGPARLAECRAALEILGGAVLLLLDGRDGLLAQDRRRLLAPLAGVLAQAAPDLVLAPSPGEAHDDHRAAAWLLRHALGPARLARRPLCLGYEVWRPLPVTHALDIGAVLERKRQALACYAARFAARGLGEGLLALNRYRGASLGLPAGGSAEAFEELGG